MTCPVNRLIRNWKWSEPFAVNDIAFKCVILAVESAKALMKREECVLRQMSYSEKFVKNLRMKTNS